MTNQVLACTWKSCPQEIQVVKYSPRMVAMRPLTLIKPWLIRNNIEVGSKRKEHLRTFSIPQVMVQSLWEISYRMVKVKQKLHKQWKTCQMVTPQFLWLKCKTVCNSMTLKHSRKILEHQRPLTERWKVAAQTLAQYLRLAMVMTSMIEHRLVTIWRWKSNHSVAEEIRME